MLSIEGIRLNIAWHSTASGRFIVTRGCDFSTVSGYGSRDSVARMTALDDEWLFIPATAASVLRTCYRLLARSR